MCRSRAYHEAPSTGSGVQLSQVKEMSLQALLPCIALLNTIQSIMAGEKPLPGVDSLTGVPKRKPVPMPADTTARGLAAWTQFSRKKQLLIIAMYLAVVCLLALIIGLAAGLAVGKR